MTNHSDEIGEAAAWRAATWEGATREAMRRWAKLPLERIVAAQEEMAELAQALHKALSLGCEAPILWLPQIENRSA